MLPSCSGQTQKHIQEVSKREVCHVLSTTACVMEKNDLSGNTLVFIALQWSVLARQ